MTLQYTRRGRMGLVLKQAAARRDAPVAIGV